MTLKIYLSVCLGLCFFPLVLSQTSPARQIADSLFGLQLHALAIEQYQNCLAADSGNLDCWFGIGQTAFALGNHFQAKKAFHRVEKDSTKAKQVWKYLASIYELEDNNALAIKYWGILAKEDSTNALNWRKLGQQFQKANLLQEAFIYYSKAYQLNPQDQYCIQALAEIFLTNRQNAQADSILIDALKIDSSHIKLNLLFARSQYQQGNYRKVTEILEPLHSQIDLTNYYAKMLGYAFLQVDSVDKAIYFLQNSLQNESDPEYAQYYLAVAFERKGELETAKFYYERAISSGISENISLYHRRLASIAKNEHQLKEAIRHYESAYRYQADPEQLIHLGMLSAEYYADKSIAIRYFKRYLDTSTPDPAYVKYAEQQIRYLQDLQHMQLAN